MTCTFTGLPIGMCAHCVKRFADEIEKPGHGFRPDKPIFASIGQSSYRMREAAQGTRDARWRFNTCSMASTHSSIRVLAGLINGRLDKEKEDELAKARIASKTVPRKSVFNS